MSAYVCSHCGRPRINDGETKCYMCHTSYDIPKFDGQKNDPWIVSAAMKLNNGLIVCSPRHFDPLCHALIEMYNIDATGAEQGFVDQYRNFYNRKEAYDIAERNGQINKTVGTELSRILFSENLY